MTPPAVQSFTDLERIEVLTKALKARDRDVAFLQNQVQYLETANERLLLRAEAAEGQK